MNLLTHSRMACAKTCLRKHYYSYELGIRKETSSQALKIGHLYHGALEDRANGVPQNSITGNTFDEYFDETPEWVKEEDDNKKWISDGCKLIVMIDGYFWKYGLASEDGVEVIANELEFKLDIVNPATGGVSRNFGVAGKIDKIVRLGDGRLAVMEHKTAADFDDDYWKRLGIDQQISLYVIAARRLGYNVETVLYDVARKPRHQLLKIPIVDADGFKTVLDENGSRVFLGSGKPRQAARKDLNEMLITSAETPNAFMNRVREIVNSDLDSYFVRREIPRLDVDIEEMEQELWQQQKLIRECQKEGFWFRNTSACINPYRCEYLDMCHQGFKKDEPIPNGFTQLKTIHPELEIEEPPHATPTPA